MLHNKNLGKTSLFSFSFVCFERDERTLRPRVAELTLNTNLRLILVKSKSLGRFNSKTKTFLFLNKINLNEFIILQLVSVGSVSS